MQDAVAHCEGNPGAVIIDDDRDTVALVMNTVIAQPATAAIGLLIIFLGAPAYWLWRRV